MQCEDTGNDDGGTGWGKAVKENDLREVRSIAADKTSFKRWQRYVTVVIDPQKQRVIDVECGRRVARHKLCVHTSRRPLYLARHCDAVVE